MYVAAHCIQNKNEETPTLLQDIQVLLGESDQHEEGRISIGVNMFKTHDDWRPSKKDFDGDIAVLELNDRVFFNDYIRPVCLLENHNDNITNGTLAGWGFYDESLKVSDVPRKIELDIFSDGDCFRADRNLVDISSQNMFCAGRKGVAVCRGDSGSGFYVNANGIHYLRGLVSSSGVNQCSDGFLELYSDVEKYLDFIKQVSGITNVIAN